MTPRIYDPKARAEAKQASREADARALASGLKSRAQLWEENSFLPAKRTMIDFENVPVLK